MTNKLDCFFITDDDKLIGPFKLKAMTVVSRKSIQNEKKYYHKLSQEKVDAIDKGGMTIAEVLKKYSRPDWCGYVDALSGIGGCWSLMDDDIRPKISEEYCKNCVDFKSKE